MKLRKKQKKSKHRSLEEKYRQYNIDCIGLDNGMTGKIEFPVSREMPNWGWID